MKQLPQISSICSTPRRKLCLAIAAQMMLSAGVQAAPTGGVIVGGDGSIDHVGVNTTIIQNSDRLAVDWESFNIAVEERVQFIQPDSSSVALNRILGNDASQIFGRLDANGHVILMNPNGVLFGENATVNVGGLVASGLSINASDFMNGDFALRAIEGTDGTVINRGIINAATGGNVALIGRQVDNQGLISAKLGSVNLAAGKEAVLTFDNEGLLGVRVTQEILQSDLGVEAAVSNSGEISAEGGRILLTGSVSQDIFSQAVNSDGLNAKTSVVMHEDGSFTLGAGADVVNTGTLSTSSDTHDSGQIVVLGENINNSGAILANNKTANSAGNIEIHSRDTTLITEQSQIRATNDGAGSGGQIKILGDRVGVLDQSHIDASGTNGGGDINIGGGFQGKETQLRNATRTVVGKDALIEANAITKGDGGDVIVWADQTTSFTGEINVLGGELGGDGGFVEVSGKENLRFLGNVDRTAVRGKSGTLLLDPENIQIVASATPTAGDLLLNDQQILFDEDAALDVQLNASAISAALEQGDVIIQARSSIYGGEAAQIEVADLSNPNSLILEAGNTITLGGPTTYFSVQLGEGNLIFNSGVLEADGAMLSGSLTLNTGGNIYLRSARALYLSAPNIRSGGALFLNGGQYVGIGYGRATGSGVIGGDLFISTGALPQSESVLLPSGSEYAFPELRLAEATAEYYGKIEFLGELTQAGQLITNFYVGGQTKVESASSANLEFLHIGGISGRDSPDIDIAAVGDIVLPYTMIGGLIDNSGTESTYIRDLAATSSEGSVRTGQAIRLSGGITIEASEKINLDFLSLEGNSDNGTVDLSAGSDIFIGEIVNNGSNTVNIAINSGGITEFGNNIFTYGGYFEARADIIVFSNGAVLDSTNLPELSDGDITLIAQQDVVLPEIQSGGNLIVESQQGSVSFDNSLIVAGESRVTAKNDVWFSNTSILLPENNVILTAGRDIHFNASSDISDRGFLELDSSNPASFIFNAGRSIVVESGLWLGTGDFVASAGTAEQLPSDFPIAGSIGIVRTFDGPGIYVRGIDRSGKIVLRSAHTIYAEYLSSGSSDTEGFIGLYANGSVFLPYAASSNGNFEVYNYAGAENSISEFQLSNGSTIELANIASFGGGSSGEISWVDALFDGDFSLATGGGDFYLKANVITHFGGTLIDTSSDNGHGDITLIARDKIQAPPIRYSHAMAGPQSENTKITIQAAQVLLDRDFDFNNAGIVDLNILSEGDVILGVIRGDEHDASTGGLFGTQPAGGRIFDSVGADSDQLNIEITANGTVFQKYDLFTGGGDYSATALNFQFNDLVTLNTDYSNETQDALTGSGNISIGASSNQLELFLPNITTQVNCIDTASCGTLKVSGANDVDADGNIHIFGDAIFDVTGDLRIIGTGPDFVGHEFGGKLSVKASSAQINTASSLRLGEWNLTSIDPQSMSGIIASMENGAHIIANDLLNVSSYIYLGADHVEMKNSESKIGRLGFIVNSIDVEYSDDLVIAGGYIYGGEDSAASRFVIGGNLTLTDGSIAAGPVTTTPDILDVDAAAPIIFDVDGNLALLGERNRLSSVQILNAQNVDIFNNGDLTLDGVNAESLSLNILGNIVQSDSLNVTGETSIIVAPGTNIDFSNPLNDFNFLSVESNGRSVINIADSGAITLSNINLDGAGQEGELNVSATSITQSENSSILLQDGAQLNLTGDFITLGANGTSTVDIKGAILNGVFANDLNIQGTIRGAAGVIDSQLAGFYINGSAADNFVEIAAGASISGDFREGSSIAMGDGDDFANIAGDVAISIEGGAGQDTFSIAPNINVAQIVGGEDLDILNGPDANSVWTIRENGDGTLNNGNALSLFADIERINGGDASDEFIIESSVALELDGGAGSNRLTANPNDTSINNQWILDGINSGSLNELLLFSSVQRLVGNGGADNVTFVEGAQIGDVSTGLGDDVFTLAANITAGSLDAGEGQDTLNLNGLSFVYTYLNQLMDRDADYAAVNFEIENNDGGGKTIVGVDGYDAEWIIDSDGGVVISATQGGITETNRFTGVTRLQGASGNDTFILQGGYIGAGIVGGQGGNDTFVADTGFRNEWSIDGVNSGKVKIVESDREQLFEAINNLVGGAGEDVFNILSGADFDGSISGGAGTNSLAIIDPAANSVWTIASTNNVRIDSSDDVGSQIAFSEIQALIGNENEDVLDLSAVAGSVDLERELATASSIQSLSFEGFDVFISNGGDFIGTGADNTWILNENSEISYQDQSGASYSLIFSGFSGLHGGDGEDHFRIDGRWYAVGGQIFAASLSGALDTVELNRDGPSVWNFNSDDSTQLYIDFADAAALFGASRSDVIDTLEASSSNRVVLLGVERNLGGRGGDVFLVYGDSGLYDPYVDGREGNDYLAAYNWGTPQDLIWNITQHNGGNINNAVQFRNFENLKSQDFFDADTTNISRFNVADGVSIGSLVGDSTNTIYAIGSGAVVGSISDNGGIDTITVAGGANNWQLTESGGQLNSTVFTGIEILNGGNVADDFILTSSTTPVAQINGGDGVSTLTAFDQANSWILNATASTLNDSLQFDNISNLIGGADVDTFAINESGLSFNIDGGAGVDELRGWEQQNAWIVDQDYAGNLNGTIDFSNVENLQGGALVDEFVIADGTSIGQVAGGDGNDVIILGTGATAINILGEAGSDSVVLGDLVTVTGLLDGGVGDTDTLDISAFTDVFEFNFSTETTNIGLAYSNFEEEILPSTGTSFFGGDGDTRWTFSTEDSFTIEKLDAEGNVIKTGTYSGYATLRGGNGVNAFLLSPSGNFDGAILGSADGDNSLTAANLINRWIIDGQNRGSLEGDSTNTVFSNIANLIGGSEADSFEIVAGGSITGTIYGGAGADTLTIGDASVTNSWQLGESNNVGSVTSFAEIETLIGNANNDIFNFTGATDVTAIQGGAGNNSVNWQAGDLVADLASDQLNAIVFTDINSVTADAANTTTLIGADTENLWTLTGIDSGSVNDFTFSGFNQLQGGSGNDVLQAADGENRWSNVDATTNALNDALLFNGMEQLVGGAGADEFSAVLVGVTAIDGGLGVNQLADSGAADNDWLIDGENSGSFNTALSFARIQNLAGSAGNDTFTFSANSSIGNINAGAGDDTFVLANNITTGVLDGGGGNDTLDRGSLNFIVTYLNELLEGDAVYIAENIETETSTGGSTTVVGVNGYSAQWTITGGGSLSVRAVGSNGIAVTNQFTGVTRAEGGTGTDEFILLEGGALTDGIFGDGDDSLQASDTPNIWKITAENGGELVAESGTTLLFQGIANLIGGSGSDLFDIATGGSIAGSIDGSAGADRLVVSDVGAANQWQLGVTNSVAQVARFQGIETITGNSGDDTFAFTGISDVTAIEGGDGNNTLLWSAGDLAVNLGTGLLNQEIQFSGISSFAADATANNTLTGADKVNSWSIDGDAAGAVSNADGSIAFSGFQTLIGGAEADTFTLAAGVNLSEIYGGAGNDVFVIGEGVIADNFYGEAGDDSFDVEVGLVLSGVLDGGSGGETEGDYINLSKYTVLDATADLETALGFAFRNFERIDNPNNRGVYFGGDGTNFWYITGANQGRLEILEGDNAGVYEFSGVHSLRGGTGEDIFIFANDAAAITTLIDGGEGAGANTLDLSAQGLINQWLLDGANSGRVINSSNAGGNIFTNIAYLIGGSGADRFELHAGGSIAGAIDGGMGNNELVVAVEQTSNWRLGEANGHSVTGVASFSNIAGLIGGTGGDIFDIFADLTDISRINGGDGSDAVNFRYDAPISVDLARGLAAGLLVEGIERFTSLNALSTLTGVDAESTWTIDGANAGSVRYLLATGEDAINVAFDGFGNLLASAGDDRFVFAQSGSLSGTLHGGAGRNAVDLQGLTNDIHVAAADVTLPAGVAGLSLANVDELIGNGRAWLYGASDRSYTWTIDGARSGRVTSTLVDDDNRLLAFENLSAIRGGAHDDIFQVTVATPLLSLDGGSAVTADLVDYSLVNGNLRINLAEALSGQNGVITGIEGIRGNNAGPDSLHTAELVGPDGGAIWRIGNFGGLADGVNDGEVAFGDQTISFLDFNLLTGGAGNDTFSQTSGVLLGVLNGGAGNDTFNFDLVGTNTGTRVIGGTGNDTLLLRGGQADGVLTYTAVATGGEFDYGLAGENYKVSHQDVESLLDQSLAETLEIRGSSLAETFALGNGRFQVNGGDLIEYRNKRDIAVRTGINDIIDIAENLQVAGTLTLANGTVTASDPASASITAPRLVLDSVRDVGLASARLRTSVDNLLVLNSVGDIYLQEQNGLNLAEFNANGVFDLLLLNGDLSNSAPLFSADVFRVTANNGDITLAGANQLRDDVALNGRRVELHNATTLTLMEVNAEDLILRTQRGIEGDGSVVVSGLTSIDAQGDVIFDFANNDFNKVRVTNAVNLTLVDQNAIELLDINASGAVVIRSTNNLTLTDQVTGGNGVSVSSGNGSINQNGSITTNNGAVVVSAGNGEVNMSDEALIVANGGSVNINAGAGDVNMGGGTRIAANGGDVNIVAADSVVVAEVVSSGTVVLNAGTGSVSDGNGGATNVTAGGLQSSSNSGFGSNDAIETAVGNINVSTNTGNVAVNNTGAVTVEGVRTGQGDISLVNQGDVELGGNSISAQDGANGGSVDISVSQGSVTQSGSTQIPAVKGTGSVVISAPDGAIGGGGGLRVDAPIVEIIAAIKAGEIFVNPGADKIEYFSGSFKFDDQLLAIAPLEDINPAIFANVRSYFFNDISLLLPRDQRYDDDEREEEE